MKKMLALSLVILMFQLTQGYATVANPWLPMSMQCGEFSDNSCYARQAQYLSFYGGKAPAMTQLIDSMNPVLGRVNTVQVGRAPAFGSSDLRVLGSYGSTDFRDIVNFNRYPSSYNDPATSFIVSPNISRSPAIVSPR